MADYVKRHDFPPAIGTIRSSTALYENLTNRIAIDRLNPPVFTLMDISCLYGVPCFCFVYLRFFFLVYLLQNIFMSFLNSRRK